MGLIPVLNTDARFDFEEQDTKLEKSWEFDKKTKTLRLKDEMEDFSIDNEGGFKYSGYAPWSSYLKQIEKITIDEGVKELPFASFTDMPNLKEVKLPSTLTKLPDFAFYNCTSLETIEIPDSVTSFGFETFFNCSSLKEITIGKELNSIGINTFEGCHSKEMKTLVLAPPKSVRSVNIPKTVEIIGTHAFANCKKLKKINIPSNVKEISDGAFYNCINLKSVTFAKDSKCIKISDFEASYGDETEEYYGAFENCQSLTALSLPDSLKNIGSYSLDNCTSLKTIHFGSNFESFIGHSSKEINYADYIGLTSLNTITVSSKNKTYSSNNGVLFNKSKTKLVWYPQNKKGNSYKIPVKVKEIGIRAFFYNKNLKSLTLSSVKKVNFGAFLNCNFQKVTIPRSVTSIDNCSFGFHQVGTRQNFVTLKNKKFTIYCQKTLQLINMLRKIKYNINFIKINCSLSF